MDKKQTFEEAKKYCNILENTIASNKKKKRENRGHLIFNKSSNAIIVAISTFTFSVAFGILLTGYFKMPSYYGIPIANVGSIFVSFVIPKILHSIFMHSKGKLGRGYAKMELDTMFVAMKDHFRKNYKDILNADSYKEVSLDVLEDFVKQTYICAENYKSDLDKYVGKKIYDRNVADFKKIVRLLHSKKNETKALKQIDKIVKENQKFTKPWCDLYNKCGSIAYNLYKKTNAMNTDYEIPNQYDFVADYDYLTVKLTNYLNENKTAVEITKNLTFETESSKNSEVKIQNSSVEKLKKYLNEKIESNEELMEK